MSGLEKWFEKPYDEAAARGERFNRLKEHYTAEAEKDCTEAVLASHDEQVTSALIDLGSIARRLRTSGDTDDKIEFINFVCLRMDVIISIYAKEQAELAIERSDDQERITRWK